MPHLNFWNVLTAMDQWGQGGWVPDFTKSTGPYPMRLLKGNEIWGNQVHFYSFKKCHIWISETSWRLWTSEVKVDEYLISQSRLVHSPRDLLKEMKYEVIKSIIIALRNATSQFLKRPDGYGPVRSRWVSTWFHKVDWSITHQTF
jgi:hypothetical protein